MPSLVAPGHLGRPVSTNLHSFTVYVKGASPFKRAERRRFHQTNLLPLHGTPQYGTSLTPGAHKADLLVGLGKLDGRLPELLELHRDGGDASQVPVARMLESL